MSVTISPFVKWLPLSGGKGFEPDSFDWTVAVAPPTTRGVMRANDPKAGFASMKAMIDQPGDAQDNACVFSPIHPPHASSHSFPIYSATG